jgi:hypothetical protein
MAVLPVGIGSEVGAGGYQIERSLRFNSADSAYLGRSFASTPTTFTLSFWIKRSSLGTIQRIFGARTAGSISNSISFTASDVLQVFSFQQSLDLNTTAVFRDISAWYHFVVSTTTGNTTVYYNGTQIATSATAWRLFNSAANGNSIGRDGDNSASFLNGYLTEINFIDGQALTPSSFGEFNSDTGVWQPIKYTGTYGTNGFYLNFSDNSGTTSTTLGKDSSGNGNNWTPNNFSVTAGAGNDSLVDSPTRYGADTGAGGEVRGNYCVMNPINAYKPTITNGNLDVTGGGDNRYATATIGMSTGKWYAEMTVVTLGAASSVGVANAPNPASTASSYVGADVTSWGYYFDGTKYTNASASSYGASYTTGDVIGIAFDADAGTLAFYKNGVSQGTAYSSLTSGPYYFAAQGRTTGGSNNVAMNFGQRPFAYTAPSGFKALVTTNLPAPTIADGGEYFNTVLYTGNGGANTITGVGFQPDFIWAKSRSSGAAFHGLWDVVRGGNNLLFSNGTDAEGAATNLNMSVNSDGFSVNGGNSSFNSNTSTQVAWNWKAGGSGVSNTAGTITSTVSVNTTSGFSIVTYTGTGSNATIGHGLGVAPRMIIWKQRAGTNSSVNFWIVWQGALSATQYLSLNATNAVGTSSSIMNSTLPTSSVFSVGTSGSVNVSAGTYVAYCFAPVAGYSAFGSYTGNGSADGVFVFAGFRPRYVLIKRSSATEDWAVFDSTRNPSNLTNLLLSPNLSSAETTVTGNPIDILSNGFKLRGTGNTVNASGSTYIYMAFAENPFSIALAR